MSSEAAKTMPEMGAGSESVESAATGRPTETEIVALAYRLWQENGYPVGSDREDWFRAEATLNKALVAKRDYLSCRPPILRRDARTEFEAFAECASKGWRGHWEVWERECGGARWVWSAPGKAAQVRILASAEAYRS